MSKWSVAIADDNERMTEILSEIMKQDEDLQGCGNRPQWRGSLSADPGQRAGHYAAGYHYAKAGRTVCDGADQPGYED